MLVFVMEEVCVLLLIIAIVPTHNILVVIAKYLCVTEFLEILVQFVVEKGSALRPIIVYAMLALQEMIVLFQFAMEKLLLILQHAVLVGATVQVLISASVVPTILDLSVNSLFAMVLVPELAMSVMKVKVLV